MAMDDERATAGLLARLDERTLALQHEIVQLKKHSIRREEFEPVKRIVYGIVGLVLIAVLTGVLALVLVGK